jgi:hypothetical protein
MPQWLILLWSASYAVPVEGSMGPPVKAKKVYLQQFMRGTRQPAGQ